MSTSPETVTLPAGHTLAVTADAFSSGVVYPFAERVGDTPGASAVAASATFTLGPFATVKRYQINPTSGSLTHVIAAVDYPTPAESEADALAATQKSDTYAGTSSYQTHWADLELDDAAGSNVGTNPKFLAAGMWNLLGAAIAGVGNYLAGVIGAYSVVAHTSDYPTAALMGVVMDGSTGADAAVLAVIDGSDPSSVTRANAAFGVRMLNNNAGSGVDYGLDLKDDGTRTDSYYSDTGEAFACDKAEIRGSKGDWCVLTGAGVPVDYTDGDPVATGEGYAGIGSLYVDLTAGKVYVNGGTKAEPLWKIVTSA